MKSILRIERRAMKCPWRWTKATVTGDGKAENLRSSVLLQRSLELTKGKPAGFPSRNDEMIGLEASRVTYKKKSNEFRILCIHMYWHTIRFFFQQSHRRVNLTAMGCRRLCCLASQIQHPQMKEVLPQPTWWIAAIQRVQIHMFHIESASSTGNETTSSTKIWVTERYSDIPATPAHKIPWSSLILFVLKIILSPGLAMRPWACWVARSPPESTGLVNLVGCTQGTPHSSGWSWLQLSVHVADLPRSTNTSSTWSLEIISIYVLQTEEAKAPLWQLTSCCFTQILLTTLLPLVLWYSCHDKRAFSTQMSGINSPLSNNLAIFNLHVCDVVQCQNSAVFGFVSQCSPCYWLGYFHV